MTKTSTAARHLRVPAAILGLWVLGAGTRAEVFLTGIGDELRANALNHMDLDDEACDAPDWRIRERFDGSYEEIRTAFQAFGYYGAEVSGMLDFGEVCWTATYEIDLGEPVLLRAVDVRLTGEAGEDPAFRALLGTAAVRSGDTLVHGAYEELKNGLMDLARRRGYAEAVFAGSRIDVYPAERAADVTLHLESGPRYRFGRIDVNQDVLEPGLIERYYNFRPGDPYDRLRVTALYSALTDSGYFETVDVRPLPPDAETRTIGVSVNLTPGTRLLLSYGVGFSTDTGPRVRLGRTNRRHNKRGAQLGINGQISPVISEVSFNYRFPYGDPRSEWISFDTGAKHEDTETTVSDSVEFGVRRVLSRRSGWQETRFLDLLFEEYEVAAEPSRTRLLKPGISWFNVTADSALRPQHGRRLGLEISGASDRLGSDTSFIQLDADGKWIWSFSNRARLLLRARLGVTWEHEFEQLPASERFFAGGDNSIRGYKFESLGPTDADGDVIGGNRLAVASVEYEHPVTGPWSVAFFVDSGGAFRDEDFETSTGVGAGFRWQSPLGPVRVDIGWPRNGFDRDPRLHISLGADL